MIHFLRNVMIVLMMTVISTVISTSNAPSQPYRYSTYPKCKDEMEDLFGDLQKITPLQCLKTAITKLSVHHGVDPDVLDYVKSFIGKFDSSKIKLPQEFCKDTVLDMYRNSETDRENLLDEIDASAKECREAIYCFGNSKDKVLKEALMDHKQGLVWYYQCEYFHKQNGFGWKYLDHIKENVNSLKDGVADDLLTPIKHCKKAHPYEPIEKKDKKHTEIKFLSREAPKDKASTSGSTKKRNRKNKP